MDCIQAFQTGTAKSWWVARGGRVSEEDGKEVRFESGIMWYFEYIGGFAGSDGHVAYLHDAGHRGPEWARVHATRESAARAARAWIAVEAQRLRDLEAALP